MNKTLTGLVACSFLFMSVDGYGFARKKMQVAELKGVTESQVAKGDGKASVMVRGKAAELVFRMLKENRQDQTDTEAMQLVGKNAEHVTVRGKQVSCSKISNPKKKVDDYACIFDVDSRGDVAAGGEAFSPSTFNLARTETGSKLFKKSKGRGIASVAAKTTYSKGLAYLVYDEPGKQRTAENALIVFRGDSAKEIMGMMENGPGTSAAHWGDAKGLKGNEIACVGATAKEPDRCALVVTFKDGSITKSGNPLFR